jgi:hypothetical protein
MAQLAQADKPEQHHKRISINITRLQPHREPRAALDERRRTIGTEAVDGLLIAALPEEAADCEGRLHEDDVVELVENTIC